MELNKHEKIRLHYSYLTDLILERSEIKNSFWVDPYCNSLDWVEMFTPIETQMWSAIRCFGKAPFYPQYPVGRYFLDFGNPSTKIGIECDGADYHTDVERDKRRDKWLAKNGWIIYRITGSDCVKEEMETDEYSTDDEKYEVLRFNYMKTCLGLVKAIAIYHFDYYPYYPRLHDVQCAAECLSERLSIKSQFHEVLLDRVMQRYYSEQERTIY